ncbi:MAG: hypothetical protein SFV54_10295 [Bryobacteraceae bacterium]|nr:hypothetical protein [Bryobacteraceae bacterium]
MADKGQLHELVEQLPESEVVAASRFLQYLIEREAPVDPEILGRIDRSAVRREPGIPHEEILKEYGL